MRVFHSSTEIVQHPDIYHSRKYLDFGSGFYITTLYDQAVKYGSRFIRRQKEAWLNTYELDFSENDWKILSFDSYDSRWLDYVYKCRNGVETEFYDMIVGGIANDKVILTLDLYFAGDITQNEALNKLRYEKPNIQYCIRSQEMIDKCLTYINSEKL